MFLLTLSEILLACMVFQRRLPLYCFVPIPCQANPGSDWLLRYMSHVSKSVTVLSVQEANAN